jgi:hypothetical protein
MESGNDLCQPSRHRSHGKRFICFRTEFGKCTTPSAGHFVSVHIRREMRIAQYTKVHDNGFKAVFPDQAADELEFHTFGIQRTDDDNGVGHEVPPSENINNNAVTASKAKITCSKAFWLILSAAPTPNPPFEKPIMSAARAAIPMKVAGFVCMQIWQIYRSASC